MNDMDAAKMEGELVELLRMALSIADRLRKTDVGICIDRALCHLGLPPVGQQDGTWFGLDPDDTSSDLESDSASNDFVSNRHPPLSRGQCHGHSVQVDHMENALAGIVWHV